MPATSPKTATAAELGQVKDIFSGLKLPIYVVPGNHDFTKKEERKAYDDLFPNRLNYAFDHGGWQFVALDTTEGTKFQNTMIGDATLKWLDANLPKLDKKKPLVVVTHFPLGEGVRMRPKNADDVLKRLTDFNLRAVYSGHLPRLHGKESRRRGADHEQVLCFQQGQPRRDKGEGLLPGDGEGREAGAAVCGGEGRLTPIRGIMMQLSDCCGTASGGCA